MGELNGIQVIDCHQHLWGRPGIPELRAFLEERHLAASCVLAIPPCKCEKVDILQNFLILNLKAQDPGRIYFLAGPDPAHLAKPGGAVAFAEEAQSLLEMGADGFKMLQGKPDMRREIGIAMDSPLYDPYFALLESTGTPVLWHVADPEEFWSRETAPEFALKFGWVYDDPAYLPKKELYAEVDRVLAKHPNLRVILAHFYFRSASIPYATEFLERWPNVVFDITPGWEMYTNFRKDLPGWKQFFTRYHDRILFGTDIIGGRQAVDPSQASTNLDSIHKICDFLGTGDGLGLDTDALHKILSQNFLALMGNKPRELDKSRIAQEGKRKLQAMAGNPNWETATRELEIDLREIGSLP